MITGKDAPRRTRWLGFGLLLATFLVGALAGAATIRVVSAREPTAAQRRDRDDARGQRNSLLDRLDLTAAQRAQADSILERRHAQLDAFWKDHGPWMRAVVDSTRQEIRAILTPEQRQKEERIRAERRAYYHDRDHDGTGRRPQ